MNTIPTPNEYEQRERAYFHAQLAAAGKGTRNERQDNEQRLLETWRDEPEEFNTRVHWLIYGNYGYGSYMAAREIVQRPRMNRTAALSQIVAALDYDVHATQARALWRKLTPEQQSTLTRLIQDTISDAMDEIRGETEQPPTPPQESAREAIRDEGVCTCGTVLRQTYKCIVDPKNDRYACDACGKTWTRYAGTRYETAAERAKRTAN